MRTVLHYKAGAYLPVTENWLHAQLKNLGRYRPVVYCHDTENLPVYPLDKVRSLDLKRGNRNLEVFLNRAGRKVLGCYPAFALAARIDRACIIHAHFGPSGCEAIGLKRLLGIPVLTSFYGYDLGALLDWAPEWRKRYEMLFERGDMFVVEGPHMKSVLAGLGCDREKIIVNHLGVDLDSLPCHPRKPPLDGTVRVLAAASFREKKGLPYAVEAFGMARASSSSIDMSMTIIGGSRGVEADEREREKVLETIRHYGLEDRVRLLGYQPYEMFRKALYDHHIFIAPSVTASDGDIEGGAPVAIIEASASGMPVISTWHCDIPEVVIDGESGYLVPERDAEALAACLTDLASDTSRWAVMGRHGREHIEKHYDARHQAEKLEGIYDSVLYGGA